MNVKVSDTQTGCLTLTFSVAWMDRWIESLFLYTHTNTQLVVPKRTDNKDDFFLTVCINVPLNLLYCN